MFFTLGKIYTQFYVAASCPYEILLIFLGGRREI